MGSFSKKVENWKSINIVSQFTPIQHMLQIFFYMPRHSTQKGEHFSHLHFISKIIHTLIDLRTISSIFKHKWKSWKIKNLSILRIFYSPQTISTGKKIYTTTMYMERQTFFFKGIFSPFSNLYGVKSLTSQRWVP